MIQVIISGAQGSGKSQLMRLMAGAVKQAKASGKLHVDDEVEFVTTCDKVTPPHAYDERDYA